MELKVLSDAFWIRLVLGGDLGFSEGFMAGEIEVDNLAALFKVSVSANEQKPHAHARLCVLQIFILNRPKPATGSESVSSLSGITSLPSKLFSLVGSFTNARVFANSLANSRSNIAAHYDLSNDMFSSFLSSDMTYSCGIYPTLDADLASSPPKKKASGAQVNGFSNTFHCDGDLSNGWKNPNGIDELEAAQMAKLHYIIRKAKITKGMRVLEIGSGWGSFAIAVR